MTFSPTFAFYNDGREPDQDMPVAFWDGIKVELNAELAHRTSFYPSRVAKGRMKRADADRELRVWQALADDLVVARSHMGCANATWAEKLHALRREIAFRRKLYPEWIAAGRMTAADADRRLLLVEQLHDLWWHSGVRDCIIIREETASIQEARKAA